MEKRVKKAHEKKAERLNLMEKQKKYDEIC